MEYLLLLQGIFGIIMNDNGLDWGHRKKDLFFDHFFQHFSTWIQKKLLR